MEREIEKRFWESASGKDLTKENKRLNDIVKRATEGLNNADFIETEF